MKTTHYLLLSVIIISNVLSSFAQLPQTYDLRTLGLMSPVKDQGSCGACWAFATIASLESRSLKTGLGNYILSEDNITDCHGFDETPCVGGSFYMSQALFSRYDGPLQSSDDPYTPSSLDCANNQTFPPVLPFFVEEVRFLPKDIQQTKQAIYDYGAVATAMFFNPANYNAATFKFYDNVITAADSLYPHCITLAGWDDNMTFPGAPGNGGWIIKDSYGTSWADNGYFYVSYYDAGILSETAYFPTIQSRAVGQANSFAYNYDEFGWVDNLNMGNNIGYAMVHYTLLPQSGFIVGQQIKRIGTYATTDNTTIEIEIYKKFNSGILSELIASETIGCPYKGFYTIPFNLRTDTLMSEFYIKAKYETPSGINNPVPIEINEPYHTTGIVLSSNSCYISPNGNTWALTGQGSMHNFDVCIKMFTVEAPRAIINYSVGELSQGESAVFNDDTPLPKDSIQWFLNDTYINSAPMLDLVFDETGTQMIKLVAYFGGISDTAIAEIEVHPYTAPRAIINYSVGELSQGESAVFNDDTPLPKDSIQWFLNDTYINSSPMLDLVFDEAGTQLIKLVAYWGGISDTAIAEIEVHPYPAPRAVINYSVEELCQGDSAVFNDDTPLPIDSIHWFLNDTYINSFPMLDLVFDEAGTQFIKLVAYFAGISDTAVAEIEVHPYPATPTITQTGNTLISSLEEHYQWYDTQGIIPGETSQSFKPSQSGTYIVEVSNKHLCSSMSAPYNYVLLSIPNITENGVLIYPNPAKNELSVSVDDNEFIEHISIYDFQGKKIFDKNWLQVKNVKIILENISSGMYFIDIKTKENIYRKKIIFE